MTTDIERQFFETFGIDKKPIYSGSKLYNAFITGYEYPQITDRLYLMLLATLTCISNIEFPYADIQKLKEDILKEVIKHQYGFDKQQVKALFKEG